MDYNVVSSVHFCIDVICLIIQYVISQAFENNRSQFEFWFGCFLFCLFYYSFSIFFSLCEGAFFKQEAYTETENVKIYL